MGIGSHFLKPAVAPLNFANVAIMGRRVSSGIRELAGENLKKQLELGIEAAAAAAKVRAADIEKLLPMARFAELAEKIAAQQKVAQQAWDDQPVATQRAGDLAKLTEIGTLPILSDSLMRLGIMAGSNAELRLALMGMSPLVQEWQQLVIAAGNTLDDDRALGGAFKMRAVRRALLIVPVLAAAAVGGFFWQRAQAARGRVNAAIGDENPCAVMAIDPGDLARATPEQKADVAKRGQACEEKRAADAKAKAEREQKEAHAKDCADLTAAVQAKKDPGKLASIPPKQLAFATRLATRALDLDDWGPNDPVFPCADTGDAAALASAFDAAVVQSTGWIDADELSPRVKGALEKGAASVPESVKNDLADRAEKESVAAIKGRRVGEIERAKRLCRLKQTFKLELKSFCRALNP